MEVILLDDAFQHRYVTPGRNILLTDYHRLITQDTILPAGRLRESAQGKERASMVIVTKCPEDISPMQYRIVAEAQRQKPLKERIYDKVTIPVWALDILIGALALALIAVIIFGRG